MGFKYRSNIDYALMQRASTKLQQNGETLIGPGGALSGKVPTRLISKTKTNPLKAL